ncbi:hypothetical protein PCYB_083530 [Plasmodium cynomolgi strain B]|uniref:Uncharacterized protein n=1 Tax=Plasmodium cynomolgi (strain B) TaxID=1120755 RepID=K6VAI4_PLACD|nr:hypothetical protein PCYB_083530 [Plasmodium cynomolgi strain B]GAB66192.1 hypothetical protein PCYB_083530 [Plasmodium cynomolgi strain B]
MSSNCSQENEDEANIIDGRFQNLLKLKARNGVGGDFSNIKFSQNGQYKRYHDFYNNKNSLQHYLKKLKACRIDADELRNILEKRLTLDRENQMLKSIQDDDKKGFGSETNSSSSNHEGLHLYRKLNFLNKNNRSKSKNKNRKRKRINSKIDKKFIIKCRTCKYVNPNGFKMGDYYTCQNCGYNDFSVLRSTVVLIPYVYLNFDA